MCRLRWRPPPLLLWQALAGAQGLPALTLGTLQPSRCDTFCKVTASVYAHQIFCKNVAVESPVIWWNAGGSTGQCACHAELHSTQTCCAPSGLMLALLPVLKHPAQVYEPQLAQASRLRHAHSAA